MLLTTFIPEKTITLNRFCGIRGRSGLPGRCLGFGASVSNADHGVATGMEQDGIGPFLDGRPDECALMGQEGREYPNPWPDAEAASTGPLPLADR